MGAFTDRDLLGEGDELLGPSIIVQMDATTVIAPRWNAIVDPGGNLILSRGTS